MRIARNRRARPYGRASVFDLYKTIQVIPALTIVTNERFPYSFLTELYFETAPIVSRKDKENYSIVREILQVRDTRTRNGIESIESQVFWRSL